MESFLHQVQLELCIHKNDAVIVPHDIMQLQSEAVHMKCKVCGVHTARPSDNNHNGANYAKAHCHNGVAGRIVWMLPSMDII